MTPQHERRSGPRPHPNSPLRERFGICQWFHYQDYPCVERAVELLRDLGVRHLRTGVSWADYYRPGGRAWYDWLMRELAGAELELLVSVWHTPPSISVGGNCSSPPRRLRDYADFIDLLLGRYGDSIDALELWNEPNNRIKWDFRRHDPDWGKFARMVGEAAFWARHRRYRTVLGGMIPVDHHWLGLMRERGVLEHIDVVAIHGFPEMWGNDLNWEWYSHWEGWRAKLDYIRPHAGERPVWITETGLATWDREQGRPDRHALQCALLQDAAAAPAERVYWYCLIDLPPHRETVEQTEGGWHEPYEYHMGLVTHDGRRKPAYDTLRELLCGDAVIRRRSSYRF